MMHRPLIDSEGARLLRRLLEGERSDDVARAVRVTRQCIDNLAGLRRRFPVLPLAAALERRYGIPIVSLLAPAEVVAVATSVSHAGATLTKKRTNAA